MFWPAIPTMLNPLFWQDGFNQNINQPKAAMDAYSRVIALDPGQQNVYLQLGGMYMEQEQWPQAKQVYEQLVKNFPGAYAGYFFLGRISAINGDRKAPGPISKKPWPWNLNWWNRVLNWGPCMKPIKNTKRRLLFIPTSWNRIPPTSRRKWPWVMRTISRVEEKGTINIHHWAA
jgi:tetratricopeptide (TPR) repeat protein